jgi:hypothetical protein
MAETDIPVARSVKMAVTTIVGKTTLIRVPECDIEGKHYSQMEVKDNVIWLHCPCCKGQGMHLLDQEYEGEAYGCDACEGFGYFKKYLEPIRMYRG